MHFSRRDLRDENALLRRQLRELQSATLGDQRSDIFKRGGEKNLAEKLKFGAGSL